MEISQKEQRLRHRVGTDRLIGCYVIDSKGSSWFADIRGEQGNTVAIDGNEVTKIAYEGTPLKSGVFYSFAWHLEENNVVIDGKPEVVKNDEFLQKLFEAKLSLNGSNLEMANNFQRTIFDEVTGSQHTYIYELLQNANDYPFDDNKVRVNFIITDNYLFFTHTGAPFNLRNVVGITSINQGEKKKNVETIGYKGIGFKTVFVNNEYVYLRSGDWSFRFDKQFSEEQFAGECPWSLMPIPTKKTEVDDEVNSTLSSLSEEMRVQFAMRHKSDARANLPQLDKVFSNNQILLFIPHVGSVDVYDGEKRIYHVDKDDSKWIVSDFHYPVPQQLRRWVEANIDNGSKVPEKFKDIANVRISFAVGRDGTNIVPVENARVYNYLPTELRLGFGFLINADFIPNGSRSGLHDVEWNNHIMRQAGIYFAEWWASFMKQEGVYDLNSIFDLLPSFTSNDSYGKLFLDGFFERIQQIPCIPTKRNGAYKVCRINEILQDRIDFFTQPETIISDEDFYSFYKTNLYLPLDGIRNNPNYKRLIDKFGPHDKKFNVMGLERLVNNSQFSKWLEIPENNIRFNGFLISSTFIQELSSRALFIRNDGHLGIAAQLYESIDQYKADLDFLEDFLPHLHETVRRGLSSYKNWDSFAKTFKPFDANNFARMILENFGKYGEWFEGLEDSVKFIHFLATTFYQGGLPDKFPLYNLEGQLVSAKSNLYQHDDFGDEFSQHVWIKSDWLQFIHESYLKRDKERVSKFFESRKIGYLTPQKTYVGFINDSSRIPYIAEAIKDKRASVDFYRYLWDIQEHTPIFSPEMRSAYTILATDGNTEDWIPIDQTIFKKDEDWEEIKCVSWMPEGRCWALKDLYYEGLDLSSSEKFQSYLAIKQIVQAFSVPGLFYHFSKNKCFSEVFDKIITVDISRDFMRFLWEYKNDTYKYMQKGDISGLPIATLGTEDLTPLSDFDEYLFIPNNELMSLYEQRWFDKSSITIISKAYDELFESGDQRSFFSILGIKRFKLIPFVKESILANLDSIRERIREKDSNLSFHRFIASIHAELSEKETEPLKSLPIFISSSKNADGIVVERSDDHYLPSSFLSDIISLDIVPIEIMDSIHPDYFQTPDDEKYLDTKLGNVRIDLEGFLTYLIKCQDEVCQYISDDKRNIYFWKWMLENVCDYRELSKLKDFPILNNVGEPEIPSALYISNQYDDSNIESFIKRFVSGARFVSSCYKENSVDLDWRKLFCAIGVRISTKEILFKDALPNLSRFRDRFIFLELAKFVSDIKARIESNDKWLIEQLAQMQLQCDDDIFRHPKDVIISGKYFDIDKETYPDIKIKNLVSPIYIEDCGENHNLRRQVVELMKCIADTFKCGCENSTQLRNKKLEYFAYNQQQYSGDASHLNIIIELASDYHNDSVGIPELLKSLPPIQLMNQSGKLCAPESLYFGKSYSPHCDFEGNGITELTYVSDAYNNGTINCYRLFQSLGVHDSFTEQNLSLLCNEEFAGYFWTEYAVKHERELISFCDYEHLFRVRCIPSFGGVKRPCDLYHVGNPRLNQIIEQIPDGKEKQPRIQLPSWLDVGLRKRLYMADCLEYLKIETLHYRKDVMGWLCDTPDDVINSHRQEISNFLNEATWYTSKKTWAPLLHLVALEWADGSSALKDSFGGNEYICNPSYMPETKMAYDRLCKILNIKILTEKDFDKKKSGHCYLDEKARYEIDKRLLYIAYKIDKKDWKNLYKEFHKQLFDTDMQQCEQILYYYNKDINSDDIYSYIDNPDVLWYVGKWDGKRFDKVLEWILNTFQLKKYNLTKSSLEKMFEMSVNKYLLKYEAAAMPEEFLSMLDEADKVGVGIDTNANYQEGVGEEYEAKLSDTHIKEGEADYNSRKSSPSSSSSSHKVDSPEEPVEEDYSTHTRANHSAEREQMGSKERQGTQPKNHTSRNQNKTRPTSSSAYGASESTGQSANADISLEERMEKKWESQRRKGISKPKSAAFYPKEEVTDIDLKGKSENKSENPNFFSGRSWTASAQSSYNSAGNKSAEAIHRHQTEAENYAEKAKEQYNLFDIFQQAKPYSFKWFKYLMELQFQEKDKHLPAPVQIDFHDWTTIDNEQKVLRIISPSRNIPKWLEDAQDVTVTLLGTSSKRLSCAITSVDGEGIELLINPDDLTQINDADKIRVNAQNHTNFIDSLQTSFLDLNFEDDYQLDENLPEDIKFIYGPPGTGKTTRLVEILCEIVKKNHSGNLNILILTPTNKAADVIAEKMYDDTVCHDSTIRFGYTDCAKLMGGESICFQNRDTMCLEDRDINMMVTTIARYAYDTIQPDGTPISDIKWDYIIVDEASMIDIVPITYLLHKGIGAHFIIAGDPKQITPIPQHNMPAYNIYNMVGLDNFKDALGGNVRYPVEGLTIQHRSIPEIGSLVSDFCYQGLVKNDAKRVIPKPLELDGMRIKHINFLGFKVQEMDLLYELTQINESAFHLYSAIFAYNMVKYIVEQIGRKYDIPYSIGIVCPYKAQAEAIQQMLENRPLDNDQCKIVCGTVHKFQGDECDIMLLVLNPPHKTFSGSHINNENIINVAMSRARDYLFFLMPEKEEDGYQIKDRLGSIIDIQDRTIQFCGDVEKIIFGNPNYIYENTSIQCHQSVNVFYDTRAKYEIRLSDTALDIQIND